MTPRIFNDFLFGQIKKLKSAFVNNCKSIIKAQLSFMDK